MSVQVEPRVAVLVPLPDNNTAALCVSPAGCRPVQLTTQAGSTRCHVLLISYSINVICTSLCTRYVHKKVQSSIIHTLKIICHLCFCLSCIFSVHFSGGSQTDWEQLRSCSSGILSHTQSREMPEGLKVILATPGSRARSYCHKGLIRVQAISDVMSCSVSCLGQANGSRCHSAGCNPREEGPGSSVLHHGNCQNARGKVITIKRRRILEATSAQAEFRNVSLKSTAVFGKIV